MIVRDNFLEKEIISLGFISRELGVEDLGISCLELILEKIFFIPSIV
ncbi:hypothetical protein bt91E135_001303 (plasmid) [Borrelia turicatae 91E135]|nr:hypothetical protein bt91E135_001303 [Borrelia turicatae 91E135]